MEIAKSLFEVRDNKGYINKEEHDKMELECSSCEQNEFIEEGQDDVDSYKGYRPLAGGPFSALIPSMWPQNILASLEQNSSNENGVTMQCEYDEFGFKLDTTESASIKTLSTRNDIHEEQRLEWIAHLQCSHNNKEGGLELTWDKVDTFLPKTNKLREMVRNGIPHSLRPQMWMRLSGALDKRHKSDKSYKDIVQRSDDDSLMTSKEIEKDILRIMPTNACYSNSTGTGVNKLRRILRALALMFPDVGYCQGTGVVVASLLLFLEEENAFWMMATIVENLLPTSFYSSTLLGIQIDQKVMSTVITTYLPPVDDILKKHDIELSLITVQWFLTIFSNVVNMTILVRIWDWFFCDGSIVLFQIILGMLKSKEANLCALENAAQIFNELSDSPGQISDVDLLFKLAMDVGASLNETIIARHRRRHLAYLMTDQEALAENSEIVSNHSKQSRELKKNKSIFQMLFYAGSQYDNSKSKNVRQTEILVDLRDAISKLCKHFINIEPKLEGHVKLVADYHMESHAKDHENFIQVSLMRQRRAKALLDFERHDDDELGFRRNDIITIISQKDEHCWVGELNGLKGWFPAKFVELLDERSKLYTSAGDDAISETVTDLVRGSLAPAIKEVLEHGMKRPIFLGGPCHPWLFIEEAATREIEKDYDSVYSRLVLCKTYRLDEDSKVLTPEELLYRCVQSVNQSHDSAHAQMDVKLRSLICMGLNEQVLHCWLEIICSCTEVVQKWYHTWSFMDSPGWVQIKCELRVLSQFAFNLNPDWELPLKREKMNHPLKDGVGDMLVKHHLFSWDL